MGDAGNISLSEENGQHCVPPVGHLCHLTLWHGSPNNGDLNVLRQQVNLAPLNLIGHWH